MLGWRPPAARGPFVSFYGYRLLFRSHTWTSQGSSAGHRFQCRQNVNREGVSGQDTAFFFISSPESLLALQWLLGGLPDNPHGLGSPHEGPGQDPLGRTKGPKPGHRCHPVGNWSRGVAAFFSASSLRRSIFRRIWPPADARPLPRSTSASLRPRGLPPGPNPGKSERLRQAAPRNAATL